MGFSMTVPKNANTLKTKKKSYFVLKNIHEKAKQKTRKVRLEPGTWTYKSSSIAEPKNGDAKTIPGGDELMVHSRKKTPSILTETPNRSHDKIPGRETPPKMLETPPLPITAVLYVLLYVRTEKIPGIRTKIPGGMIVFHPRKKTPSVQIETQERGHEKNPGREMPPEIMEPLPSRGSPLFPGTKQAVPGRAPSRPPRSPSATAAPLLLRGPPRAAVWGGRGAVARPRVVWWRSG